MAEDLEQYCAGGEVPAEVDAEVQASLRRTEDLIRKGWDIAISQAVVELRSKSMHEAVEAISCLKYEGHAK